MRRQEVARSGCQWQRSRLSSHCMVIDCIFTENSPMASARGQPAVQQTCNSCYCILGVDDSDRIGKANSAQESANATAHSIIVPSPTGHSVSYLPILNLSSCLVASFIASWRVTEPPRVCIWIQSTLLHWDVEEIPTCQVRSSISIFTVPTQHACPDHGTNGCPRLPACLPILILPSSPPLHPLSFIPLSSDNLLLSGNPLPLHSSELVESSLLLNCQAFLCR